MYGTPDAGTRQQRDEPRDLTPTAELYDVLPVAGARGAGGRFVGGLCAEARNQIMGSRQCGGVGDIGDELHVGDVTRIVPEAHHPRALRQTIVNAPAPVQLWDSLHPGPARSGRAGPGPSDVAKRPAMDRPPHNPRAGGMPIALGIMAGAIGGAVLGEATIGLLVGLAIGIVIAIVIWRRDSR